LGTSSTNPWQMVVKQLLKNAFQEALDAHDSGDSTSCDDEAEHESGRYGLDSPIGSRLLARKLEVQQERFAQQAFVLSSAPIVAHGPRQDDGLNRVPFLLTPVPCTQLTGTPVITRQMITGVPTLAAEQQLDRAYGSEFEGVRV
jgi:hypothetical protein